MKDQHPTSKISLRGCSRLLMASLILAIVSQSSCRHRSRTSDVVGQAPKIAIKLQDIRQQDRAHPNFIYEAHNCGEETPVIGKLGKEDSGDEGVNVEFSIKGIKVGDTCRVDIRLPNAEAFEHKIRFSERELLMYQAQDAVVRRDIYGNYIATANLKRTYFFDLPDPGQKLFEVQVGLEFPEPIAEGANLDGNITCDPSLRPVDTNVRITGGHKAELTLDALYLEGEDNRYECRRLSIYVDNRFTYFRNLTGSSRVTLTAKADETVVFSQAPVKLVHAEPHISEGIVVDTEGAECQQGQVFDTVRRECIDVADE